MEFAEPREITSPDGCSFYQTFDWPDGSVVEGMWDYRDDPNGCLGGIDYAGKSVLEVGPASGFLTLQLERQGAEVFCIDTDPEYSWDVVPRRDRDAVAYAEQRAKGIHRLHDSWWATWNAFEMSAKMSYIGASRLSEVDRTFDVGFIASILQHFENPYVVLSQMARLCTTIVITEPIVPRIHGETPLIEFAPTTKNETLGSWYLLNSATVESMMKTLLFDKVDESRSSYPFYYERTKVDGDRQKFLDYNFISQIFTDTAEQ